MCLALRESKPIARTSRPELSGSFFASVLEASMELDAAEAAGHASFFEPHWLQWAWQHPWPLP